MKSISKWYNTIIVVSIAITIFFIIFSNWFCFTWCDEICFSDMPNNFIKRGQWSSHVLNNTYPPLYGLLLTVWFFIFGVSHVVACSLEIVITEACFLLLYRFLTERQIIKGLPASLTFMFLFWFGFYFPVVFTMARVDMLVMLITIALIDGVFRPYNKANKYYLFVSAVLLSFTALYILPIVSLFIIYLWLTGKSGYRRIIFNKGLLVAGGFVVGLLFTMSFHLATNNLLNFFMVAVGHNNSITSDQSAIYYRIINSYIDYPTLALFVMSLVIMGRQRNLKKNIVLLVFISLIPTLMTLAGRYERYYWWIMYIPVVCYLSMSIELLHGKTSKLVLSTFVIVLCIASQIFLWQNPGRNRLSLLFNNERTVSDCWQEQTLANSIVGDSKEIINKYDDLVFVSESLYYPLANTGKLCWYIFQGQYPENVETAIVTHDRTKWTNRLWDDSVRGSENRYFPKKGAFFAINSLQKKECATFLKKHNYFFHITPVANQPEAFVIEFHE